jgi:putative PIG3 family NAD(P)H quinone oxidoreductase
VRAIGLRKFGSAEVLEELTLPDPRPEPNEVLIKVEAIGINRADILIREGRYPVRKDFPVIPGFEVAGTIIEVGGQVARFQIGQKVFALLEIGGYAEQVTVFKDLVLPIPSSLSPVEAAGIPDVFLTAWITLSERAKLQRGETVLIHAAGSGIGIAAIQLAKNLGAKVITTASTEEKLNKARELGADYTINYRETDFAEAVKEITKGRGVEVILDGVGGSTLPKDIDALAWSGRLLLIGTVGGREVQIHLGRIIMKNLTLFAFQLHGHAQAEMGQYLQKFGKEVLPLFKKNQISCLVDKTFPLSEAKEAHVYIEQRKNFGKVVLVP